jgi:outer membrane immunogenic protein
MRFTTQAAAAAAVLLAMSGPALAADAPYNWTGARLGLNGGFNNGTAHSGGGAFGNLSNGSYWATPDDVAVGASTKRDLQPSGYNAGVEASYKHQFGNWVPGVDLGFGSFHNSDSFVATNGYPTNSAVKYTVYSNIETDWLFTLRPKLGYAWDRFLLEGGAGLAMTKITVEQNFIDTQARVERATASATKTGWTAGAALNYALSDSWSIKGEYLYTAFSGVRATGNLVNNSTVDRARVTQDYNLTVSTFRLGIDYRF